LEHKRNNQLTQFFEELFVASNFTQSKSAKREGDKPAKNWAEMIEEARSSFHHIKGAGHFFSEETWKALANLAPTQEYPRGIGLFRQGAIAQDVYFLQEGLVKLVRVEQTGREFIVGLCSPGWFVGADSLLLGKRYAFSGITLTDCQLRRISGEAIIKLLKTDLQFSWHFHHVQSCIIHDQLSQIVALGMLSARDRLEQLLWVLISLIKPKHKEGRIKLHLPLKHWELAQLIAVTPEHLSRILREMHEEGIVCKEKGWMVITNANMLRGPLDV